MRDPLSACAERRRMALQDLTDRLHPRHALARKCDHLALICVFFQKHKTSRCPRPVLLPHDQGAFTAATGDVRPATPRGDRPVAPALIGCPALTGVSHRPQVFSTAARVGTAVQARARGLSQPRPSRGAHTRLHTGKQKIGFTVQYAINHSDIAQNAIKFLQVRYAQFGHQIPVAVGRVQRIKLGDAAQKADDLGR